MYNTTTIDTHEDHRRLFLVTPYRVVTNSAQEKKLFKVLSKYETALFFASAYTSITHLKINYDIQLI